jgi:hypothetical protein
VEQLEDARLMDKRPQLEPLGHDASCCTRIINVNRPVTWADGWQVKE